VGAREVRADRRARFGCHREGSHGRRYKGASALECVGLSVLRRCPRLANTCFGAGLLGGDVTVSLSCEHVLRRGFTRWRCHGVPVLRVRASARIQRVEMTGGYDVCAVLSVSAFDSVAGAGASVLGSVSG
jgi:hypothetical protein